MRQPYGQRTICTPLRDVRRGQRDVHRADSDLHGLRLVYTAAVHLTFPSQNSAVQTPPSSSPPASPSPQLCPPGLFIAQCQLMIDLHCPDLSPSCCSCTAALPYYIPSFPHLDLPYLSNTSPYHKDFFIFWWRCFLCENSNALNHRHVSLSVSQVHPLRVCVPLDNTRMFRG